MHSLGHHCLSSHDRLAHYHLSKSLNSVQSTLHLRRKYALHCRQLRHIGIWHLRCSARSRNAASAKGALAGLYRVKVISTIYTR